MPFYWRQLPNLRYKPRPHLIPGRDHLSACSRHFEEQLAKYGKQVLVNLVSLSTEFKINMYLIFQVCEFS